VQRRRIQDGVVENIENGGAVRIQSAVDKFHRLSSQFPRHEYAIGIFSVVRKWRAIVESITRIKRARRLEELHRTRLQTHAPISRSPRFAQNKLKNRFADSFASMLRRGAHRFKLGMFGIESLERAAADQLRPVPDGPEGDFRPFKAV